LSRKENISNDDAPKKKRRGRPPKPKKRGRKPKPKKIGRPEKKNPVGRPKKKKNIGRPKKEKKKPVGRPKKRGRPKKGSYRKKTSSSKVIKMFNSQNYNEVKSLLWKNFKNEYSSYSDFLKGRRDAMGMPIKGTSITARVIELCPDRRCSIDEILQLYRRVKDYEKGLPENIPVEAGEMPQMPFLMFDWMSNYFWELDLLTTHGDILPENLWVNAEGFIFSDSKVFYGKDWEKHKKGFLPLIRYLNRFQDSAKVYRKIDQYVAHWLLGNLMPDGSLSPDPIWNDVDKRWEVKLFLVTKDGEVSNFGFSADVNEAMLDLPDTIESERYPKKGEVEVKTDTGTEKGIENEERIIEAKKKLLEAEIELEKAKEKRILAETKAKIDEAKATALNAFTKAFEDGRITFEQYMEMFNKLSI
jgi:hypothetical protein